MGFLKSKYKIEQKILQKIIHNRSKLEKETEVLASLQFFTTRRQKRKHSKQFQVLIKKSFIGVLG